MGADMVAAVIAAKKGAILNFEAGRNAVEKIDFTDEQLLQDLVDNCNLDEEDYFDEDGKPLLQEIQKWAKEQVDEVAAVLNGREVAEFYIRDLNVWVVGGMSWGDVPEGCYPIWTLDWLPGVYEAIGFEPGFSREEERDVTPEEEQAAVQSIVGVGS